MIGIDNLITQKKNDFVKTIPMNVSVWNNSKYFLIPSNEIHKMQNHYTSKI